MQTPPYRARITCSGTFTGLDRLPLFIRLRVQLYRPLARPEK